MHPKSATKAQKKSTKAIDNNQSDSGPPPSHGNSTGNSSGGTYSTNTTEVKGNDLASVIHPWDCSIFDSTNNVLLMTTAEYPAVLVKLQQTAENRQVAAEMANEARVYAALAANEAVQDAVVPFFGYNTRFGVAMTCLGLEGDDLDDLGVENVSDELKLCAVRAVELISNAGVLHNDLDLRNIVQCRDDPNRAKIVDFGRSVLSSDDALLAAQVQHAKILLGLGSVVNAKQKDIHPE